MIQVLIRISVALFTGLAAAVLLAASPGPDRVQRYIVELQDPPLASYDGGPVSLAQSVKEANRLQATSPRRTGASRLDAGSPQSLAYLRYLDQAHDAFRLEAAVLLGRTVHPVHVYRNAVNGMALDLTADQAAALARSPAVKSIQADTRHRLQTDAGPAWIGAAQVWNGGSGFGPSKGEGVVIGVIDSGVNWDHPSFANPGGDGFNHANPFGVRLGLCADPEVVCNNKLVGVYDFVEDDPDTGDVEESTKGKDNSGHGSHVAAIAAGNVINVTLNGTVNTNLSGVAPHANIVAYRVCFIGNPPAPDGGGCLASAILSAIDQAITDGVDVINYSIGTIPFNPWADGTISMAYLNAREAGIFVATSGGNEGPNAGSVGSPADAPWIVAVGNATHNRIFASLVQNLAGGDTAPPGDLVGASFGGGLAQRRIVHARDFGFALCAAGVAELGPTCNDNLGLSNPWSGQQPFNGEIVVCDRGTYGRIEKGKNVMLAGAGGYILANTDNEAESIVADEHCLPASHIGAEDGDSLRAWLASGSNHVGSISGFTLAEDEGFADQVASSSSRGPLGSPFDNILKPNVIAPGTSILSAAETGSQLAVLSGTSMSSPHVAGAAALLRAVHPEWSIAQIASSLETTATAALATDSDGSDATPLERGAGRPRLGEAVNAGLYLDVTTAQFTAANPAIGGNPGNLNLAGLVNSNCQASCSFTRTVTDQMGGGNWAAMPEHFPAGVSVAISPANFTLGNGASRALTITVNVENSGIVGDWVYGNILLSAAGSPTQALTVAVFSSGGDLPPQWTITDQRSTGWQAFTVPGGLVAMPDATFTSGGLVLPTHTSQTLPPDTTELDPFDGGAGVFTVWHDLPQGGLWLHAETLTSSAADVDLYVGRDDNLDGVVDLEEQLCGSLTPSDIEQCDLFDLPPGNYWVLVQNFDGTVAAGDEVTLISAAVDSSEQSTLLVSGPGIVAADESFQLRASWDDLKVLPGQTVLGAVGIGTRRENPNNVGVIPVRLTRNGSGPAQTLPLMNGKTHRFALAGNATHDRMFVDIPPNVTSLQVQAAGSSNAQSNGLSLTLHRQDFNAALANPPFAQLPQGLATVASASGLGGVGPAVALTGPVAPGRYFVKLSNASANVASVTVVAHITSTTSTLNPHRGLWDADRNIAQGMEWNRSGAFSFTLWYTYDDAGQPSWYIASAPTVSGNVWTADLLRVTNDGSAQQEHRAGTLAVTFIADDRVIYSFSLLGEAGFETMHPNAANTCPDIGGGPSSYTGHWFRGTAGLGGSTVLVYAAAQAQIHYLYDARGEPRWVIAADDDNQSATADTIPLLQFSGFCPTCADSGFSFSNVGQVVRVFSDETSGSWSLDFSLAAPLSQMVDRTDSIVKLSDTLVCQ